VVRVGQAKCRRHATAKRRTQTERETAHRSLNPSARRALNWLSNVTTVVTVVALGLYLVARPATRLAYAERSHLGTKAASTADSAPDLRGRRRPLLSRDSLTLLVVLGNTCHACQDEAEAYAAYVKWASVQSVSARLVLPSEPHGVAADFARLAGDEHAIVTASAEWYDRLGVRDFPTVILLDRKGIIRARYLGWLPSHLAVLNVIG